MKCQRCGKDVPDFLWTGDDHPVLMDHPISIHQTPLAGSLNEIKVTMHAYVEMRMCSDTMSLNTFETVVIDGTECVVVHIGKDDEHRNTAACNGQPFKLPAQNDKRPATLCEACRRKVFGLED